MLQNAIATPFLNEPSVYSYSSSGGSDQPALTQLQIEVMGVLERMGEQVLSNLALLNHLLPLMYYQYLALSLYAVNISEFSTIFFASFLILAISHSSTAFGRLYQFTVSATIPSR